MTTKTRKAHSKTYGEKKLFQLMKSLPDDYLGFEEPAINVEKGARYPDAIIACWKQGIAVIEIKDWKRIDEDSNQQTFNIWTDNGDYKQVTNPAKTARNYGIALSRLLEEQPALVTNRKRLILPWQEMVIFANLSQKKVNQFMRANVIPSGVAFGKEVLDSVQNLEKALRNLPWKFKLSIPLKPHQRDAVRAILVPTFIDKDGRILTEDQWYFLQKRLRY